MTKKRSGISVDRAYRIQTDLLERLREVYSSARIFKSTHEAITEGVLARVYNTPEAKRAPARVIAFLRGYEEALRNVMWNQDLCWVLSVDDKLLTSKEVDELTREEEDRITRLQEVGFPLTYTLRNHRSPWSRVDGDKSRHVWRGENGLPMLDKPFDRKWIEQ